MENTTLFYNGKIYLGSKQFGYGFELKNNYFNKIFFDKNEIDFSIYNHKVNLNNKLVLPSLIDTHAHMLLESRNSQSIDLTNVKNFQELKDIITNKITLEDPKYILCENFNEINIDLNKFLDRHDLDVINSQVPIFIFRVDLHTVFVNTIGLEFLEIFEKNKVHHVEGEIELSASDSLPNGILRESACQIVRNKIASFHNFEFDYNQLVNLSKKLVNYGIANVVTCDIFQGNEYYIYKLFAKLGEQEILRINHQVVFYDSDKLRDFLKTISINCVQEFNKINDIKIFNDGSLGSKTAYLSKPYHNEKSYCGIKNYEKQDIESFIKIANEFNKQIAIHSIGDESSRMCIEILKTNDKFNLKRHKLIHFQLFNQDLVRQVSNHNILLSIQPCFLESDLNILNKYVDNTIASFSYHFKKIHELNKSIVSFSTDAPVCSFNPWLNIYYAILGNQLDKPKQNCKAFDIYDAIQCYTENAAYSLFEENKRGKIKVNYLADFIVLNQDIFNLKKEKEILNTTVISHYINGKKVL